MTATAEPSAEVEAPPARVVLDRAEGLELLGEVHGSGYESGACLVRRADGQMVHLGPLMYALLECVDGERDVADLRTCLSESVGKEFDEEHVIRLAEKLGGHGLLAGTEEKAPPKSNPLLALRWKVLVTNPPVTRRLTTPFTFLFRPWVMVPVLLCFLGVCWFVLFHKGLASATSQALQNPELLLLVFGLAILSAGFHELGHASACRYGGATPSGMGMGLYMVWPAFYTDVTDAYRLPRRDRLRTDLGGLYFNAIVAVATMGVWLAWHVDALLLLIALQLIEMVKQLSPVIRADGYHILADATGVPDLYAHIGPTLRRLLPGHRHEASALTGRARLIVTLWVLIVVPVLLGLMVAAVLVLPRLIATAWDSGHHIAAGLPHQFSSGHIVDGLASILRLVALLLPALGSAYITYRLGKSGTKRALAWSRGRPVRRGAVVAVAAVLAAGLAWAWWPAGQYQPVTGNERGTLTGLFRLASSPRTVATPAGVAPGRHLAIAMVPRGGVSATHPVLFVVPGRDGRATALLGDTANGPALSFPFRLPAAPGPGDTQALALNTTDGGVVYDVEYALITITDGEAVPNTNSAFAIASCNGCTTVAVSFQVVLVIDESNIVAPINAAGALNYECPACMTTALAEQMVITLKAQPPLALQKQLEGELQKLDAITLLGDNVTPAAVAAQVAAIESEIEEELRASGLLADSTTTKVQATASPTPTNTATPGGVR